MGTGIGSLSTGFRITVSEYTGLFASPGHDDSLKSHRSGTQKGVISLLTTRALAKVSEVSATPRGRVQFSPPQALPTYPTEVTKPEGALIFPDGLLQESQV